MAVPTPTGAAGAKRPVSRAAAHRPARPRRPSGLLRRVAVVGSLVAAGMGLLAGPLTLPAAADGGTVSDFIATAQLDADGTLHVQQLISFSGTAPAQLSQTFTLKQDVVGNRQYVMTLSDVTAKVGDKLVTPTESDDGRYHTVTIDTAGTNRAEFSYTVTGAVRTIDSGTALQWPLLQGPERAGESVRRDGQAAEAVHLSGVQRRESELAGTVPGRGRRHR